MDWINEEHRIERLPYRLPSKLTSIYDHFKKAVSKSNTSAVIVIDGRSGMGKSTLANQCAKYCDANYGINKIHYTPDSFLNGGDGKIGLKQARPGDAILFDEAMLISSRSALSQINRMIVQAMSMIRSKNLYVFFCVNSCFDLDKNLILSRADLLLHVYGQSLTDRGQFCAFFTGADGFPRIKSLYLNGKKYYDYSKPRANFIARFPKHFVVDEDEYEAQKQIGVNDFLSQTTGKNIGTAITIQQRDKAIYLLYEKYGCSSEEIADFLNITPRTVTRAVKKVKEGGIR